MSRRRLATLATACLMVLSVLAISSSSASGATAQRTAPIRFLHQVNPSARGAATAAAGGDTGMAAEIADLPNLHRVLRDEPSPTGGEEEGAAPAKVVNVPIGSGKPTMSFDALNHFDSRYSGNGNQFSGEPPDQGLCAGNGRVLEVVNSVLQVYTPSGTPLIEGEPAFPGTGPVGLTLNEFYGLPPSFVRPDGPFGPDLFDVSCLYDAAAGHWFVIADENDLDAETGAFSGPTAIFIAVSTTANPLGAWSVYDIDTTNNGENGTPDHGCSSTFCFADYPQPGLNANGLYISTNEFDNIGDGEFHGAQLYAFSKSDLEAGDTTPSSVYIENIVSEAADFLAYTLQPVNALAAQWDTRAGGTMYFGMSLSPLTDNGVARSLSLWSLTGTSSLNSAHPNPVLTEVEVATQKYVVPPLSQQLGGKTPFLKCVNQGVDCIGTDYPFIRGPIPIDSGSGKFYGAWLHNGVVYLTTTSSYRGQGAADYDSSDGSWTPVDEHVGVAYFGVRPTPTGSPSATLVQQGKVAVARNNLVYPSIAIGPSGRGAIGVTLSGLDFNPSAAYIPFVAGQAPTSVQIAGLAVGPDDGFTGTGEGGFRPRWGDYGAATVSDSGSVWIATEYINQRCSFGEFSNDTTCGFTRTFFANWSTRLFRLPG